MNWDAERGRTNYIYRSMSPSPQGQGFPIANGNLVLRRIPPSCKRRNPPYLGIRDVPGEDTIARSDHHPKKHIGAPQEHGRSLLTINGIRGLSKTGRPAGHSSWNCRRDAGPDRAPRKGEARGSAVSDTGLARTDAESKLLPGAGGSRWRPSG